VYTAGRNKKCAFCNSDRGSKTDEEQVEEILKRVEANHPSAMCLLASHYQHGNGGLQQDEGRAMEFWTQAAKLGSSDPLCRLGINYDERGDLKKAKFHYEAAAMAGHEVARHNLGCMEYESGNMERAVKHCIIAASAGHMMP
jgi:TPR repeat protein